MRRFVGMRPQQRPWWLMAVCALAMTAGCGSDAPEESSESYWAVVAADFDGDGLMDVAASLHARSAPPHAGTVTVFLQDRDAPGRFLAPHRYAVGNDPVAMNAGDFNRDGRVDIATFNEILASSGVGVQGLSVLLQTAAAPGRFAPALSCVPYGAGSPVGDTGAGCAGLSLPGDFRNDDVVVADLNGDGLTDQVVAHFGTISSPCEAFNCSVVGARVSVALQDAASPGRYLAPVDYPAADFVAGVAVADMNGDGRPDLVVAQTDALYIRHQDPSRPGAFLPPVRIDR